ncbi:hypothetical protein GGS23DRAFT_595721 [Durotheca rogersii]|uniref:uncharacterized protein n=1 Tax=Durotheca rogersii TaxID=419775 RepID=UPI00221F786B|nr:uncharacterized protein GGS23DRAFT_595721 [Durotheca rogersii]KAI5864070.1 hypothetical protein GGS23DRAFT_595721 [Durotheca rogersii]
MKTFTILVGLAATLGAAQAPSFPSGFPNCGVVCVSNMLREASNLGCGNDSSASCLCTNPDFIYGIRDCATESCEGQDATRVISYGAQWCANGGVAISGVPPVSGDTSPSTTVIATGSYTSGAGSGGSRTTSPPAGPSEAVTTITNSDGSVLTSTIGTASTENTQGSASGTNGGGAPVPISTATIESTITNGDSVITSPVATSTIFSDGEAPTGSESGSVVTGVTESVITTDGSTVTTSVTTTGPAPAEGTGETGGNGGEPSPTEGADGNSAPANPAAQRTAAPAGIIIAAGLAAMML